MAAMAGSKSKAKPKPKPRSKPRDPLVRFEKEKTQQEQAAQKRVLGIIQQAKEAADKRKVEDEQAKAEFERARSHPDALEPDTRPPAPTHRTAAKKRTRETAPHSQPLGFTDIDAELRDRVERDPKEKFQIERRVHTSKTRFIPFARGRDPYEFYSTETHLCCMWCTEPICGIPIPLPMKWSDVLKTFSVFGQYCSFNCMLAGATQQGVSPSLARFMMSRVYGISMREEVQAASSPFVLQKFGGVMTIEAFRATHRLGIKHKELSHPLTPYNAGIEEVEKMVIVVREDCEGGEVVKRLRQTVNVRRGISSQQPIENTPRSRMQKGRLARAPSIQEQISYSSQRLRLQMQDTGLDKVRRKKRTLMDFISKQKPPSK